MAINYSKNFENCNHHLSKKAIVFWTRVNKRFGNARFDAKEEGYDKKFGREIKELLDQEFLLSKQETLYSCNKIIIGKGR